MKRQRGRGRKPGGGGGNGGGGNHNHGNRSLESNGPEVKIRGTAAQIYEKYAQYARDAQSGGDRVRYENYLQHAEHYYRVMAATMPRERLLAQQEGGPQQNAQQNGDSGTSQLIDNGMSGGQADSMKVMDDQGGDDGDDGYDGDEGDDARDAGRDNVGRDNAGPEDVQAVSGGQNNNQQAGQDDRDDGPDGGPDGDRQGRRRRRGRRRPHDGQAGGDRPQAQGGGNGGGGDTEARSALDSLARKQGALTGG